MSLRFLVEFSRYPAEIGAIAPSSSVLARVMVEASNLRAAETIVEFGPGTGSITREILAVRKRESRFLAIERSPSFATHLARRFPGLNVLCDSVENLPRLLEDRGIDGVDCIVSGLPWASFSGARRQHMLAAAHAALRPGGRFATYSYLPGPMLPGGRRFRRMLESSFTEVRTTSAVWRNLPPALVYVCTA